MAQTLPTKLDDLVAWEASPEYSRIDAVIKNATGAAVALTHTRGLPVKTVSGVYCIGLEADAASTTGIVISDFPLSLADTVTDTQKHTILFRGPAILRKDGISATDAAGAALTKATVITALAALNVPIAVSAQPTVTTTQTT